MKFYIKIQLVFILSVLMLAMSGCKKYLDKQPDKTLIIPHTLSDLQSILDNYKIMNQNNSVISEVMGGDLYVLSNDWASAYGIDYRLLYIWDKDANLSNAWSWLYQPVFYANVVLDALPSMDTKVNIAVYNDIKGQALFFRSFSFYQLAQLYCRPFSNTASTDLGISLRLTSGVTSPSTRATVQQTYDQIIADLKMALELLPENTVSPVRPGKVAALALLARVYLSMRDYENAHKYADAALNSQNILLDYNTLNPGAAFPVPTMNVEVIFHASGIESAILPPIAKIDSVLYKSYDDNDLRKSIFFQKNSDNTYSFKGSYGSENSFDVFYGLTVDEMYLVRAECAAIAGNKDAALEDLNTLLKKRWNNSVAYPEITATDATDALNKILTERRKELVYRGQRWTDLRRRNLENANIELTRKVNGNNYTLPSNDLRWVLLIPSDVISLSNLQQNPR